MVQIIKGSYGMRVGKTIKPVSANDGPVELPKKEEERLISLGVAVKVAANSEDKSNNGEGKPNKPASKKGKGKGKTNTEEENNDETLGDDGDATPDDRDEEETPADELPEFDAADAVV